MSLIAKESNVFPGFRITVCLLEQLQVCRKMTWAAQAVIPALGRRRENGKLRSQLHGARLAGAAGETLARKTYKGRTDRKKRGKAKDQKFGAPTLCCVHPSTSLPAAWQSADPLFSCYTLDRQDLINQLRAGNIARPSSCTF